MSDELKPCPFCGNKDIQRYNYVNEKFRVTCRDCRNTTKDWDGVDDAIEKWNTRVDPSPKWTYCEDALPTKNGEEYIVSYKQGDSLFTTCATWDELAGSFYWDVGPFGEFLENVYAWMPLPAPAEPKEAK